MGQSIRQEKAARRASSRRELRRVRGSDELQTDADRCRPMQGSEGCNRRPQARTRESIQLRDPHAFAWATSSQLFTVFFCIIFRSGSNLASNHTPANLKGRLLCGFLVHWGLGTP